MVCALFDRQLLHSVGIRMCPVLSLGSASFQFTNSATTIALWRGFANLLIVALELASRVQAAIAEKTYLFTVPIRKSVERGALFLHPFCS